MGILKRILLAPALWLEKYAIRDGQFTDNARRLAKIVTGISIVTLVADPLLSLIRFGDFGLSHPLYYIAMAGLILTIYLVIRPNAETSLLDMKRSRNWVVKAAFYLMLGIVQFLDWIVERRPNLSSFPEATDEDDDLLHPIGADGMQLDDDTRMAMYMDDMAGPP